MGVRWLAPLLAAVAGCGDAAPPDDARARAAGAMAVLDGWWFDSVGLWTEHWWNAANSLDVVVGYTAATGDEKWEPRIGAVFDKNASMQFLNGFYDDEGWWALSWIDAFDLTGDARYLAAAKAIFDDMKLGWDATCNGGVWWNKTHTFKNAITNELFLTVAARLHARTMGDGGAGSYLDWAQREWTWLDASGLVDAQSLVDDGLDGSCQPVMPLQLWSYNHGVVLAGLADLAQATGDMTLLTRAGAIADAARAHFTDGNGVVHEMCEPNCNSDGAQFKGIFVRDLAYLNARHPVAAWHDLIAADAAAVWAHDRAGDGATDGNGNPLAADSLGLVWSGPFDSADPVRQTAALDALVADVALK